VLSDASFQAHAQQLLRLDGELHRQLAEDLLAEAVHDHVDRVLERDAALLAVEELVLADLRGRCLVLVNGFCKEVFRELPMEFAVEASKLLGVSLEGSVG